VNFCERVYRNAWVNHKLLAEKTIYVKFIYGPKYIMNFLFINFSIRNQEKNQKENALHGTDQQNR